jgi:hypothetical protein
LPVSGALVALVAIAVFIGTKRAWFDGISSDSKALFWTNVAVGFGTIALASVTYWNIRQTNKVIAGEDRRHQQQFSPLVELYDYRAADKMGNSYGFGAVNIGNGLALNVVIRIDATLHFTEQSRVEISEDERAQLRAEAFSQGTGYQDIVLGGKYYKYVNTPSSKPLSLLYECSAIKASKAYVYFPCELVAEKVGWSERLEYRSVVLEYDDMFGNKYGTVYQDSALARYQWLQPDHLRIPRGDALSASSVHDDVTNQR